MNGHDGIVAEDIRWGTKPIPAVGPLPKEPTAPSLDALLLDVSQFIRRYVVLTCDEATTIALWIAHTHAIAAADCTPYLQITSATKRAGKTRLLELLDVLVARPWLTGRTTAAALIRKTDSQQPTLLLDESDAAFKGEKEYAEILRGILNSGYRRSGRATACIGQGANFTVRDFKTFGAKAIAGIGALPGTVADRAIVIELRRRRSDEPCERWRERDGRADAMLLRDKLASWGEDKIVIGALRSARPTMPGALGDRQQDVWEPLVAIAELAGGEWLSHARRAMLALGGSVDDRDIGVELLADVADILRETNESFIPTEWLLDRLIERIDRPWAIYRRDGQPLSGRGLAGLLKGFGVHPGKQERARGYRTDAFDDPIARYVQSQAPSRQLHTKDTVGAQFSNWPASTSAGASKMQKTRTKVAGMALARIVTSDSEEASTNNRCAGRVGRWAFSGSCKPPYI